MERPHLAETVFVRHTVTDRPATPSNGVDLAPHATARFGIEFLAPIEDPLAASRPARPVALKDTGAPFHTGPPQSAFRQETSLPLAGDVASDLAAQVGQTDGRPVPGVRHISRRRVLVTMAVP